MLTTCAGVQRYNPAGVASIIRLADRTERVDENELFKMGSVRKDRRTW